ncbi:MAG TPA: S41 family peptidase [Caulobacteraceae bacterium]
MRKYFLVGASCFMLGAGGMAAVNAKALAGQPNADTFHMLELFGNILATVDASYVAPVEHKKLIESAIDGMVSSLDPHSSYLSPDDFEEMRALTKGEYAGLGIEITSEEGVAKVISPMDDTPAAKAGIKAGDYITAIDGSSIVGEKLDEVVKKLRGESGQGVTLTLVRDKKDPFDVKLVRQIIAVKSVKSRMEGDYGYIRISAVNENTGRETVEAVRKLKAGAPAMKGVVLDLRNNPGGLLDQSIEVSDVFLDGGEVVSERGRNPKDIERFNAKGGDMLGGLPMVVLINGGSASAAEIIAGALQDRKRAEVIGLTSFGKGSVQSVIALRGGQDGALKLTTGRYYTPSGRSIQKTGIDPDLEVARTKEEADYVANKSTQFSEATFTNALNASEGKVRREAHKVSYAPPEGYDAKADYQLDKAIEVLKAGSVRAFVGSHRPAGTQVAQAGPAKASPTAKEKPGPTVAQAKPPGG